MREIADENVKHQERQMKAGLQPRGFKVWVHCTGGTGRTAFMAQILKRMFSPYDGWTFEMLYNTIMKEYDQNGNPNDGRSYEKKHVHNAFDELNGEKSTLRHNREAIIKSLPSRLFAKNRPAVAFQYYRFVHGKGYNNASEFDCWTFLFRDGTAIQKETKGT